MKRLVASFAVLLACTAWADLRVEIARRPDGGTATSAVMVRVTGGNPGELYWIQTSTDCGATWEDYIRVESGDWWYVSTRAAATIYRARMM